ncbi:hypothetical protein Nepgr_011963 [Nepenthes gracilis]|uniref:Uncharacterized protein n=1 Tax=Nepenthes gracilis TaxID=150966 RepID=A0AAD3XMF9_NEPGR|nr:hypothetical protein Nepgr_011963 [Nepenthes gracilis]
MRQCLTCGPSSGTMPPSRWFSFLFDIHPWSFVAVSTEQCLSSLVSLTLLGGSLNVGHTRVLYNLTRLVWSVPLCIPDWLLDAGTSITQIPAGIFDVGSSRNFEKLTNR